METHSCCDIFLLFLPPWMRICASGSAGASSFFLNLLMALMSICRIAQLQDEGLPGSTQRRIRSALLHVPLMHYLRISSHGSLQVSLIIFIVSSDN